ncbi:hypothetical protein J7T55_011242 [Diaporthe amygdali]|uniref:uncharacterized protein n=1 Tax=Phomopsis amygdali TaxID=1214568 RepID=UPI0022FDB59E|nr:uncharacterized protein J7T55_011242 [Diaporthe amygdali]KAJ0108751.1 hypothetical protein J7T55_011242 [Diaporthe amygdali]
MSQGRVTKLDTASYHVAWICPVASLELTPARLLLDESHERPEIDGQYDDNIYKFGSMAGHNVVIATCPAGMTGQVGVGSIAGPLFKTFPNIRMTLLVGIGGGVPQKHLFSEPLQDVRLGDVVVGWPSSKDGKPAVICYDAGRSRIHGFQATMQINRPHMVLLKALPILENDHDFGESEFHTLQAKLQNHEKFGSQFKHPGLEHDLLFKPTYEHVGDYDSNCVECDKNNLVQRKSRREDQKESFIFHQGRIATGNAVMMDGQKRDLINEQYGDVYCIEMEAAGVDINSNCLVIRGISDYADSHKSDLWRSYAAGKAAVFARELLNKIPAKDVKEKMATVNKHWLVHRSTNPHFTGRHNIIDKIVRAISPEPTTDQQRRFVVTGMGGQGKSEICLHVANEVRDRFWAIFWVDVSTQNTAENNFSEVADALGCPKSIDEVRKALSNLPPTKTWLLILDNADDLRRDHQIYIPSGNRGAILVTSRNPQCGRLALAGGYEELDSLQEAECMQLLRRSSRLPEFWQETSEDTAALVLVKELAYHTLAINHAASMEFLESSETGASDETRKDALRLLHILSTFHHESVPLDILIDACEGSEKALQTPKEWEMDSGWLTAWHVAQVPDLVRTEKDNARFRITEAVARLEALALVKTDSPVRTGVWKFVSMHPLVHGWARDRHRGEKKKAALRMSQCIVALGIYGCRGWRPYHIQFRTHLWQLVDSDADLVDDAAQSRRILQMCVSIAWVFKSMRLETDMYKLANRILHRSGLYDQEPTEELRELYCLFALAVGGVGSRPAETVRAFEKIARLDEQTRGENDRWRLENLRRLGWAYQKNGQTKEAVALLRKVVRAFQELGEEHESLLNAQHALASALGDNNETEEAAVLLEKVVEIDERLLPADHPDLLTSQHSLAVAYLKNGQVAEATARLEEVVKHNAQTLGEEHHHTATILAWLADAYLRAGRVTDAIELRERVVNIQKYTHDEKHPDLLTSQNNLAVAYFKVGKVSEAVGLLEWVVNIRRSTLEPKNGALLTSQLCLAQAYLEAERVPEAIEILERVIEVARSWYDEGNPGRVRSQRLLDKAYAMCDYPSSQSSETSLSVSETSQLDPFSELVEERASADPDCAPGVEAA